ncbi:ankyrin repeat domain-containing protein 27-like [Glandiceps talaboti]
METYDEDIAENRFFHLMQSKYKQLYEKAADNRWTICIPRSGTFSRHSQTSSDMENHILRSVQNNSQTYVTVSDKEVKVTGDIITTTNGFKEVKSVRVLFEETFFNNRDESFRVLCVDQLLEGGTVETDDQPFLVNLDSLEDCTDFLWGQKVSKRSQRQVDEMIDFFNKTYQRLEAESLRYCIDAANALFTKSVQTALKDSYHRKAVKINRSFMDNLKVAMETYVMNGVFKKVFKAVSTFYAREDANLNKINRNLAELQLKDLGIRAQFTQNVPRARRELSDLNKYSTPLEKLYCLRRTIMTITHASLRRRKNTLISPITTDDLLPILVFLVVKSDIANWLANLTYMQNFRFSKPSNDEFGFYMASIEAAVEHVKSGNLANMMAGKSSPPKLGISTAPSVQMPWQRQDSFDGDTTQSIDVLFEHIKEGSLEDVERMLQLSSRDQRAVSEGMCHPLCSCEKCAALVERKRNDPSTVTVFSRDDRGCTALHIAASYGQAKIIELLVKRGGVINATDYHGSTPLHLACQRGHQNATLLLLDCRGSPNLADNDGNTPLHQCCANGHEDCVKAVVYFDKAIVPVDVNAANLQGDTPLHHASRWGYEGIVEILLEHNASVEAVNRRKETPLLCAHNVKVSRLLMRAMEKNKELISPSSPPTASTVLASPVRPSVMDQISVQVSPIKSKTTGLSAVEQQKEKQVLKLLKAVADNDIQLVRYQLGWLSDSESDEDETMSADSLKLCHPLCQCERCQTLQRRTSVSSSQMIHSNSANHNGLTSMHIAAAHGHESLVSLLIRRGANVNCRNKTQQCTPLHLAAQYNRPGVMTILLNHGAKGNTRDSKGNTPLHFCCQNGHVQVAELLLKSGASVNVMNHRGNSPLHEAARWNQLELVKLTLGAGANITARNKAQLTPLQYAQNDDVISILEDAEDGYFESSGEYSSSASNTTLSRSPAKGGNTLSRSPAKDGQTASQRSTQGNKVPAIPASSPTRQLSMKDLFKAFEESDMNQLRELGESIQTFDKDKELKKTITRDMSAPRLDDPLKHQLSIQHFDQDRLKHVDTDDRSSPSVSTEDLDMAGQDQTSQDMHAQSTQNRHRTKSFEIGSPNNSDEGSNGMEREEDANDKDLSDFDENYYGVSETKSIQNCAGDERTYSKSERKSSTGIAIPGKTSHGSTADMGNSAEEVKAPVLGTNPAKELKVSVLKQTGNAMQDIEQNDTSKVMNSEKDANRKGDANTGSICTDMHIDSGVDETKDTNSDTEVTLDDLDLDLDASDKVNDSTSSNVDIATLEKEIHDLLDGDDE